MKIHHNIIAATILGACLIVAAIIYKYAPQPGRFIYKESNDDVTISHWVFDSATGTKYAYDQINAKEPISFWSVFTTDDYVKRANENQNAK